MSSASTEPGSPTTTDLAGGGANEGGVQGGQSGPGPKCQQIDTGAATLTFSGSSRRNATGICTDDANFSANSCTLVVDPTGVNGDGNPPYSYSVSETFLVVFPDGSTSQITVEAAGTSDTSNLDQPPGVTVNADGSTGQGHGYVEDGLVSDSGSLTIGPDGGSMDVHLAPAVGEEGGTGNLHIAGTWRRIWSCQ